MGGHRLEPKHSVWLEANRDVGYVSYFIPGPFTQSVHITLSKDTCQRIKEIISEEASEFFMKQQKDYEAKK